VLPHLAEVHDAARTAGPPSPQLVKLLEPLHRLIPASLD
jgi:hypothetical protein